MCYLRNFSPIQKTFTSKQRGIDGLSSDFENNETPLPEKFNVDFKFLQNQESIGLFNGNSGLLMNLLKLAQKNNQALQNISMKMEKNVFLLDEIDDKSDTSKMTKHLQQNQADTDESSIQSETSFKTQQFLTQKLFGENKQYKYKLVLDGAFPEQIFKERNFNFDIKLTNLNGSTVRNSNIIHLCLGVSDVNGEWITESKSKQPLMKGKTESQLYHGQASYTKIFSRDVSRNYADGKLNIVVYPKTSVLTYCQATNLLQQAVNSQEVEPLILKDLTIKAKKKQ